MASEADKKPSKAEKKAEADQKACIKLIAEWANDKEDSFPKALKDLLTKLSFPQILVTKEKPPVLLLPYEARQFDKIHVQPTTLATPSVLAQFPLAERFQAHVVPTLPYNEETRQAIKTFPAGYFAAVDLNAPGARVVVTQQLSGCSFVIGFDKRNKNRCFFGHGQPGPSPPPAASAAGGKKSGPSSGHPAGLSPRAQLAQHFKEADGKTIFAGEEVKDVYVMGGDSKGYGDGSVNILGWISGGKIFLAVFNHATKKTSFHQYPPPPPSLIGRLRS